MKDFIVSSGRGLFDLGAIIILIAIIFLGGAFAQQGEIGFALATWVGGYILFVMSYYFVYTFIDINDNLKTLNRKIDTLISYQRVVAEKIIEDRKKAQ